MKYCKFFAFFFFATFSVSAFSQQCFDNYVYDYTTGQGKTVTECIDYNWYTPAPPNANDPYNNAGGLVCEYRLVDVYGRIEKVCR